MAGMYSRPSWAAKPLRAASFNFSTLAQVSFKVCQLTLYSVCIILRDRSGEKVRDAGDRSLSLSAPRSVSFSNKLFSVSTMPPSAGTKFFPCFFSTLRFNAR